MKQARCVSVGLLAAAMQGRAMPTRPPEGLLCAHAHPAKVGMRGVGLEQSATKTC